MFDLFLYEKIYKNIPHIHCNWNPNVFSVFSKFNIYGRE